MSRKAIVHIGPMKTGSSSIQSWLNRARAGLREAGFLVPGSIGASNMSRLSYMAQVLAAGEELAPADAKRLSSLREEITSQPDSVHTVIFSGEMLAHQLKRPNELRVFKSMLDEFFDGYTIVLYLRRQDEFSLSRYSTALRHGSRRAQPLSSPIDYETILQPWSEMFGRDAIHARIFDRKAMPQGDVVQDFVEALGLPVVRARRRPISRNSSILPEAQAFLADLAARVRQAESSSLLTELPGHDIITKALDRGFSGRGTKPSREDAIAFFEKKRDSNERVRRAWFPDRTALFSDDFSEYAEEATPEPTAEQVLEVAMSALVALLTQAAQNDFSESGPAGAAPRRNARGKEEMRIRRNRRRKMRARRESGAESEEGL